MYILNHRHRHIKHCTVNEHAEPLEEQFCALGSTIGTLIAQKKQHTEDKFGTKPKTFSSQASFMYT